MHQALAVLRKLKFFLKFDYPHKFFVENRFIGPLKEFKDEDRKLMKLVAEDLDGYLPFPRRAPSVLHAMSTGLANRPLDQSLLFSAIAFRAVFFKSRYHFAHNTFLRNLDDYKDRVKQQPSKLSAIITPGVKTDDYWANPNMYSGGPHKPSVEYLELYWKSVHAVYPPHKAFKQPPISASKQLPFNLFWKEYLLFNRKIERSGEKVNLFRNVGGLIGYLCALDLSYAGHVEKPSMDDVVEAMTKVNSGGVRGLIAMGLLEKREGKGSYPVEEVSAAFSVWHNFLDRHLSEEEKKVMVFDCPMSEHSSCKISKFATARGKVLTFSDNYAYTPCACCS